MVRGRKPGLRGDKGGKNQNKGKKKKWICHGLHNELFRAIESCDYQQSSHPTIAPRPHQFHVLRHKSAVLTHEATMGLHQPPTL